MPSITGWYDPTPRGGALRLAANSYLPGANDPGVRLAGLRKGDLVVLEDGRVKSVNGLPPETLATRPEFADGIHPDGHGGLHVPPAGALTYQPGAETTALVRARDRHCRFTGCTMPAARCQLDHITAFDHDNRAAGGWTIPSNTQCLCAFHHALKTAGLWHARALHLAAARYSSPRRLPGPHTLSPHRSPSG